MEQVGWANPEVLEALAPQLAAGKTCAGSLTLTLTLSLTMEP